MTIVDRIDEAIILKILAGMKDKKTRSNAIPKDGDLLQVKVWLTVERISKIKWPVRQHHLDAARAKLAEAAE